MKKPKSLTEHESPLADDLKETLKEVGPGNYARATAKQFAPGGPYSAQRKKRQKFALT